VQVPSTWIHSLSSWNIFKHVQPS